MTKPEPSEVALRGPGSGWSPLGMPCSRKSWKNFSNGEPGGKSGISGPGWSPPPAVFKVCVVEMLTTEGSSLAARSAKLSGAGRAIAGRLTTIAGKANRDAATALTATRRTKVEARHDTGSTPRGEPRSLVLDDHSGQD